MGFIISYLTHRLEADAPQSMMLPVLFYSPDLCTESSPAGEARLDCRINYGQTPGLLISTSNTRDFLRTIKIIACVFNFGLIS